LQECVEAVICVRGYLRDGTDDGLSLRPPDFERLVQALVDDELERPGEAQRGGCLVDPADPRRWKPRSRPFDPTQSRTRPEAEVDWPRKPTEGEATKNQPQDLHTLPPFLTHRAD
jgi:hypothetical protein